MRFSLPYTPGILDYIQSLPPEDRDQINDIYFSDPTINPTARHFNDTDFVDDMWDDLKFLKFDFGIEMNYTMNSSVWKNEVYQPAGKQMLIENLRTIYNHGCTMLTFNNLMLLRDIEFREHIPPFKIKLSVNNKISTLDELKFLHDNVSLNYFILDRSINRNIDEIKRIHNYTKDKNIKLTLLAQEGCLTKCPFKQTCDNMIATFHDYDEHEVNDLRLQHSQKFCDAHYQEKPEDLLKSPWISPPGLVVYEDYIDYVKLAGRGVNINIIKASFDAYLKRSADISLADLFASHHYSETIKSISVFELEEKNYTNQTKSCRNRCADCDYCDRVYQSIVNDN
jgi:collagenase-like PrtC family protease